MVSFYKIITVANILKIYVVLVVGSMMLLNNMVYLTWSPIANVAMKVYGWSDDVIYLLNSKTLLSLGKVRTFIVINLNAIKFETKHEQCKSDCRKICKTPWECS